jgi:predicted RNase H-like HicB family nuclease
MTMPSAFQVVIYAEGDGYVAQCLNVDVASEGASEEEARSNILEALQLYFEEPTLDEPVSLVQPCVSP